MKLFITLCFTLLSITAFSQQATFYKPSNPDSIQLRYILNNVARYSYMRDLVTTSNIYNRTQIDSLLGLDSNNYIKNRGAATLAYQYVAPLSSASLSKVKIQDSALFMNGIYLYNGIQGNTSYITNNEANYAFRFRYGGVSGNTFRFIPSGSFDYGLPAHAGTFITTTDLAPYARTADVDSAKTNLRAEIAAKTVDLIVDATLTGAGSNASPLGVNFTGYVSTSRTITINGTALDLSANRSWTIAAGGNYIHQYNGNAAYYFGGDTAFHFLSKNADSLGSQLPSYYLNRANHTGTQAATTITEDATHRFSTDAEKSTWNGKQDALGFTPYNATNPSGYITSSALAPYLPTATAATIYFPLLGGTITGTGGNGYVGFKSQSTRPATPPSGEIREFVDSLNQRAYINSAGRTRSFNYRNNPTDVVYYYQNKAGGYVVGDSASIANDSIRINANTTNIALKISASNYIVRETPTGTSNGVNTTFTIANTPVSGKEMVFVNGILQYYTDDYTISGATLTMVVAPRSTDKIRVTYIY